MQSYWIQILANLGTLIASIFTFLTLLEIKTQRRCSMQPDIVIKKIDRVNLFLNTKDNKLCGCPYIWSILNEELPLTNNYYFPDFKIELLNIGVGTAKNIKLKWDFNIEYLIQYLTNQSDTIEYQFDNDYDSNMILKTESSVCFVSGINKYASIEYIKKNEECKVDLCTLYIYLYSAYIYFKTLENDYSIIKEIIPLNLQIYYEDLAGKKYIKDYIMNYSFYSLGLESSSGYIDVKYNKNSMHINIPWFT